MINARAHNAINKALRALRDEEMARTESQLGLGTIITHLLTDNNYEAGEARTRLRQLYHHFLSEEP
jgi:hypothetical protein